MANVFIQDSTMSAIGDAIRAKTGGTDKLLPADMATAISGITTGGGGGGLYTAGTVYGSGSGPVTVQHNLGVIPDLFLIYCPANITSGNYDGLLRVAFGVSANLFDKLDLKSPQFSFEVDGSFATWGGKLEDTVQTRPLREATASSIVVGKDTDNMWMYSQEFTWLALSLS